MRVATELGFLGRVEPPEIKKEEKKAEVKVEEKLDIKIDEKSEVKHEEKDMLPPSVPEKVDDEHLSKQEIVEMDVDLTVKKEKDGVIPMDVEKSILYPWPVSKILNQRVRKLLKAIETQKRQQEKQERIELRNKKKEHKAEEKAKKDSEWTKREKFDFYRALVNFGVPTNEDGETCDWEFIKNKANLKRKSVLIIEEYYVEFLKQCKKEMESQGTKEKTAKVSSEILPDISYGQCKRVLTRVTTLSVLRKEVLPHPELEAKLLKLATPKLPRWWDHKSDIGLAKGVSKYGFVNPEEICADLDLPFYHQAQKMKKVESKKGKEKVKKEKEKVEKEKEKVETTDGDKDEKEKEKEEKMKLVTLLKFPKEKAIQKRIELIITTVKKPSLAKDKEKESEKAPQSLLSKKKKQSTIDAFTKESEKKDKKDSDTDSDFEKPKKKSKIRSRWYRRI